MENLTTTTNLWMKTSILCTHLIKALTASNNGNKQNKPKNLWRFRNRSRFNFSWTKKILSYGILTINILYSSITCFKGSNMFILGVFIFRKIFNLFVFMILASLMNFKCYLGELEKYEYNYCNFFSNLANMDTFDKSWISWFIVWVMQYCPIM